MSQVEFCQESLWKFLGWKQKVLVPGKNYQSLAWIGVGGAPSTRAADSMVTYWSGTSSFACHKVGSSVCTKHIKLWPYTCQECLGHGHLLLPCSPVSVFLLLFSHHFYTDHGEWSLSSVLCRTLSAFFIFTLPTEQILTGKSNLQV